MNNSKLCAKCKQVQPFDNFYKRSGVDNPSISGHYASECKACMKTRAKTQKRYDAHTPRWDTEQTAINYLQSNGVPALPGKALRVADVDVVAWGHIHVEVKHANIEDGNTFTFVTTPRQQKRGLLAHVVLLICNYGSHTTYHLFRADHPVFFIHGRVKTGLNYVVGTERATKHQFNRVVMTDGMMQQAQDRIELISEMMAEISQSLIKRA